MGRIIRTVEKGIDTAIVTDMISLAWANAWDVAVLVSSDRDYIPLVEFLTTKGLKVINAYFPPHGAHLARTCWANIDFRPHLPALARSTSK
ncbi:MAG: NYN domain-containing protein [Chloroflexi bacterium]|nr:NYN domain-containing protein [Chloroflexota bacterium]